MLNKEQQDEIDAMIADGESETFIKPLRDYYEHINSLSEEERLAFEQKEQTMLDRTSSEEMANIALGEEPPNE